MHFTMEASEADHVVVVQYEDRSLWYRPVLERINRLWAKRHGYAYVQGSWTVNTATTAIGASTLEYQPVGRPTGRPTRPTTKLSSWSSPCHCTCIRHRVFECEALISFLFNPAPRDFFLENLTKKRRRKKYIIILCWPAKAQPSLSILVLFFSNKKDPCITLV